MKPPIDKPSSTNSHEPRRFSNRWSSTKLIGPFRTNTVVVGDAYDLVSQLPEESVDVLVTSPPYWGQRAGLGLGSEDDPRDYLSWLVRFFELMVPKLKEDGLVWINLGDAYNTPVNWREGDHVYSRLGPDGVGLPRNNSAYAKPRLRRKAYIDARSQWLRYGNLLALPHRLVVMLGDRGYLFRGEIVWRKLNAMPEGRCRRPHRQHEGIYLFARSERHRFRISPPVPSVWEFSPDKAPANRHFSRFPTELPGRCIDALGEAGSHVVVLDPFAGSGTTGVAAITRGCTFIGFEIDERHAASANRRLEAAATQIPILAA
jgi:DNA modification methylase